MAVFHEQLEFHDDHGKLTAAHQTQYSASRGAVGINRCFGNVQLAHSSVSSVHELQLGRSWQSPVPPETDHT